MNRFRSIWFTWAFAGVLALLCVVLAVLQNRWIYEISAAERDRLHITQHADLNRLGREFDQRIAIAGFALLPALSQTLANDASVNARYRQWKGTNEPIFRRVGRVTMESGQAQLSLPDPAGTHFVHAEWPKEWSGMQGRFIAREKRLRLPPFLPDESMLLEFSRFGGPPRGPMSPGQLFEHRGPPPGDWFTGGGRPGPPQEGAFDRAQEFWRTQSGNPRAPDPRAEWWIAELNLDYIRVTFLPELLTKHFADLSTGYDAEIVLDSQPSIRILNTLTTRQGTIDKPEASVTLLDPARLAVAQHGLNDAPAHMIDLGRGRWRLLISHRGSSLEDLITRARWRNIAVSSGILLLILTTAVTLLHYSRQSQRLAELQMNFVAGVSHELRTPLTVIRTAAFNLRGRVATRPEQVEKYGQLIQSESEKLTILVDQVLRYGAMTAGKVIREKHPVEVQSLIANMRPNGGAAGKELVVERLVEPDLPPILADEVALQHALQNLLDNAVNYGLGDDCWIGIFARAVGDEAVEIRVVDRGPGIPLGEQSRIFEAFYRGSSALREQIHGTGLGLNLVKKIIDAHGGTIRVSSEPFVRTEFVIRIPAASKEIRNAVTNSIG